MGYGAYLAHHGVKGMKWGHHKAMTNTGSAVKSKDFEGQGGGGGEPIDNEEEDEIRDLLSDAKEGIREGVVDEIVWSLKRGKKPDLSNVSESTKKAIEQVQQAHELKKKQREKERNHKRLQKATKKAAKSLERYKKKKKKQEEYFKKHVTVSFQDAKITNDGHPGRDVKHSDISAYQNYLSHHGLST